MNSRHILPMGEMIGNVYPSPTGGEGTVATAVQSSPPIGLLSVQKAAKALGISDRTLRKYTIPNGSIPCIWIGGRKLYDPVALRRWEDEQQRFS